MLLSTGEQVSVALVAMAIHDLGAKAVSLTGGQIGMKTDNSFSKARIQSISTERIERLLDEGNIVVAAGFQGIDDDLNITTLGRGGSDTTAVALAAVLGADACEIYTDVDGVYTTDPRLLARSATRGRDQLRRNAGTGQPRCRRDAQSQHRICQEVRRPDSRPQQFLRYRRDDDRRRSRSRQSQPVSGAAMTPDEARVTVLGVPDVPGKSRADLFRDRGPKDRRRHGRAKRRQGRVARTSPSPFPAAN